MEQMLKAKAVGVTGMEIDEATASTKSNLKEEELVNEIGKMSSKLQAMEQTGSENLKALNEKVDSILSWKVGMIALEDSVPLMERNSTRAQTNSPEAEPSGKSQSICIFGLHATDKMINGDLSEVVEMLGEALGSTATVLAVRPLGKVRELMSGEKTIGVKVKLANYKEVETVMERRREVEKLMGGHLVHDLRREDIVIRRRRVQIMLKLRVMGFWVRVDGLQLLIIRDNMWDSGWLHISEEEAALMLAQHKDMMDGLRMK